MGAVDDDNVPWVGGSNLKSKVEPQDVCSIAPQPSRRNKGNMVTSRRDLKVTTSLNLLMEPMQQLVQACGSLG